jgi:ligand-binding sensor domain-containing protein/two-component sensor histidine kinase
MMNEWRWKQAKPWAAVAAVPCLITVLLSGAPVVCAQQLSIRHYSERDGLAYYRVHCIYQDVKGYLWVGTWNGLSRFDGYRFTNYGSRDGLERPFISAIVEDQQGRLWVGTLDGLARLVDDSQEAPGFRSGNATRTTRKKFVTYAAGKNVFTLLLDAHNTLWCVADGLYRAPIDPTGDPTLELVVPGEGVGFADRQGHLWFGTSDEFIQIVQGRLIKYALPDEPGRGEITSIVEDHQGRLLVAYEHAVFEFIAPTELSATNSPGGNTKSRGRWQRWPLTLMPDQLTTAMLTDSTGALWIGTHQGLIKYHKGRQTVYTTAQGLSDDHILALREDREGNLWVGTNWGGLCKLSGGMIISFTKAEGLPDHDVHKVIEDQEGRIYASTHQGGLAEIVEGKAVPIPGSQAPPFHNIQKRIFQDRRGDWWIGTGEAIFVFQGPTLQFRHGQKLTIKDPYPIFCEDPAGQVWIGTSDGRLYRCHRGRASHLVVERISLGARVSLGPIITMMSDHSGALWLASFGQLLRWVRGTVVVFEPMEGLPETGPRAFFQDSRGWLWLGLRWKGVSVTKDPTAAQPTFVNYSTENGLASDTILTIAEDDSGRIYLGMEHGLDQLDPVTGRIRHFTMADGLPWNRINHCLKDRHGNIWGATARGLSKLNPRAERPVTSPPPIYLSRVQVGGQDLSLPETGTLRLPELKLSAAQNNVRIEYVGLSFEGEQTLKYEYKLEGVDADWNPPTQERSVNYASLSPGTYRFLVRAVNADGLPSATPATVAFTILPPIWQRWWFLTFIAVLLAGVTTMIYRYRVARLLELERVRTRIATDLHDDIGASLSEMAILTEVVKQHHSVTDAESVRMLTHIAERARGLVDSMSDIVWAIDPRQDDLSNVVLRIAELASEVLEAKGIACQIHTPPEPEKVKLIPEQRRHLYLIFKEALTNIVRHAHCASVSLTMTVSDHQLVAEIRDDGCGFVSTLPGDGARRSRGGHGLENMQARAAQLGGQLRIDSAPGQGTRLTLTMPLHHRFH